MVETARILEIQRMSTEDGPGIRTTFFFKGCSLKCTWCHNPESLSPAPQVQWISSRCIGCRTCLETCSRQALAFEPDGLVIDRHRCDGCGECARECPTTALEMLGVTWELTDLVREAEKDRTYYHSSGGGVTASGGEPGLQFSFVADFFRILQQKNIHTALDTCGGYGPQVLPALLPVTDLVLFDLKEIDPEQHRKFTGFSLEQIVKNLLTACDYIGHNPETKLWIRTPIIPGATARRENIHGIGRLLAEQIPVRVDRWELCAFNHLCRDKYRRLDMPWPFADCPLLAREKMENLAAVARSSGVNPEIVHWSGSVQEE